MAISEFPTATEAAWAQEYNRRHEAERRVAELEAVVRQAVERLDRRQPCTAHHDDRCNACMAVSGATRADVVREVRATLRAALAPTEEPPGPEMRSVLAAFATDFLYRCDEGACSWVGQQTRTDDAGIRRCPRCGSCAIVEPPGHPLGAGS